jgi:hypothetical protein
MTIIIQNAENQSNKPNGVIYAKDICRDVNDNWLLRRIAERKLPGFKSSSFTVEDLESTREELLNSPRRAPELREKFGKEIVEAPVLLDVLYREHYSYNQN